MSGDDEIDGSEAPLLDHLIELRRRLLYCVVALVITFAVCFGFARNSAATMATISTIAGR